MNSLRAVKNRSYFGHWLNRHGLVGAGVEIGVFDGVHADMILSSWKGEQLFLVDIWQEAPWVLETCHKRLAAHSDRAVFIKKDSLSAAKDFANNFLDFAYIDADHSEEAVYKDLVAWYPKVRPGGVLCGHDYGPEVDGDGRWIGNNSVARAVHRFVADHPLFIHTSECTSFWMVKSV